MTTAPAFATPYQSPIITVPMIKGMTSKLDTVMAMSRVHHESGDRCRRFHSNTVVAVLILWHMSHLVNQPDITVDVRPSVTL